MNDSLQVTSWTPQRQRELTAHMNVQLLNVLAKKEAGRLCAKAFKKARESLGMTQAELATALGMSLTSVRDREQSVCEVTRKDLLALEALQAVRKSLK